MIDLSILDAVVCIGYLAIVFGLALLSARGQQDNEDYFLGGRRMNWFVVGVSMFATSFSSISFLGIPQRGAYQDFSFYLTILFILVVITPILWFVFVPVFVRLNVTSGYEYLGRRFGTPARWIGAALYCLYAIGWMGTMLYAVALTLKVVMGLGDRGYLIALIGIGACATLYTVMGGLKAVIWTDVLQAVVLGGAIVIVMVMAIGKIDGGWAAFVDIASQGGKFKMFHLNSNLLARSNFTRPDSVYTAIALGLFMYLPGYAVSQNMIQRYVCAGTLARGRAVVALSAVINVVLGLLFLLVGAALYAYYTQAGSGLPVAGVDLQSEDQILPYFVTNELSGLGLAGLILAGLFAAAMSTIDSGINGITSVIVFDWLKGRALRIRTSRIITAFLGAAVICAALFVPVLGENIIVIITAVASISLGMLLAVFMLGMLVPRANSGGVYAGLAAGFCCLALVWKFTDIPRWWFGAFTIVPTFVVGALVSPLFEAPSKAALEGTLLRSGRRAK